MMKNKNTIVWLLLMLFTVFGVSISGKNFAIILLLVLAIVKIFLVVFQFMELKKAHLFWKMSFSILIFIVTLSLYIIIPK